MCPPLITPPRVKVWPYLDLGIQGVKIKFNFLENSKIVVKVWEKISHHHVKTVKKISHHHTWKCEQILDLGIQGVIDS